MSFSRHTILLGALLAVLSFSLFAGTALGAQGDPLTELQVEVANGRLDQELLTGLQAGHSVQGLVLLDDSAILQASESRKRGRGIREDDEIERSVKVQSFGRQKTEALRQAGNGARVLRDYDHFATQFVEFDNPSALLRLLRDPEVRGVRANAIHAPTLLQSLPLVRQPEAAAAGHTGVGASVAIIDTGLDYTKAAFGCTAVATPAATCPVVFMQDFAANDNLLDANGHGTNVGAITHAVAPGAKLLGLDVFVGNGASSVDINAALNWVVANKTTYNIVAVNLSLGDSSHFVNTCNGLNGTPVSWAQTAFANLLAAGVLPVVAAGNGGTVSGAFVNGLAMPACTAGAVSVGAVYDSNMGGITWSSCPDATTAADKITCFSQSAPILSLLAPGALIEAAGFNFGGTSQAAPHVAGAVALLAGAVPVSTASQRLAALTTTGPNITDVRNGVTKHRLDVCAALAAAGAACGAPVPDNPPPAITLLSPSTAVAGSPGFTLTIDGSGFIAGSAVTFGGAAKTASVDSATQLRITVAAADIATPGDKTVVVTNGLPGGGTASTTFTVTPAPAPVPTLTSLSPASVQAGSAAFLLTVNGTGFTAASVISFGGADQSTTFVSATQLRATIAATAITTVGTPVVTVSTPTPGGGTSNPLTFNVTAIPPPPPPTPVVRFSLLNGQTLGGTAFANEDIVEYNGTTWTFYFDGSDVGLGNARLDGFQVLTDGSILLSFANRLDGLSIGRVEDSDIIRFVPSPTSTGATTAGTFQFFFRGPANGFAAGTEDIDAFFYGGAGQPLYISTTSNWTVGAVSGTDRDIVACAAFLANGACNAPSIFFDGDDIGLTGSSEDIDAFVVGSDGTIYFSTTGSFSLTGLTGLAGLGNDVVACSGPATGGTTSCTALTRQLVGNNSGISGNGLTGFGLVP